MYSEMVNDASTIFGLFFSKNCKKFSFQNYKIEDREFCLRQSLLQNLVL